MHRDLTIGDYVVAIRAELKCLVSPDVVTGYTVSFSIRRIDGNFLPDNVLAETSEEIAPKNHYFSSVKTALDAGEQEARVRIGDIEARRGIS
ncbi:hypothetical protein BGLT_02193 [Caballeronia glathei]|uniref:Uncharacterized protein n=1 Tax=Caballeronia glathei TaxID=60547 RepID=A0A069PQA4_9BURK|nr:hypothetical protein [Caballeronia glathei]KDR39491.1 hypothetical protein BG61_31945 [Caballeronia glathei]CDY79412.1 hypothetical protein BGLT_02193 [Caballeronia glathei]